MVGGGGRVVNGSRGGDLRRVVDGASLVLLETLKNLFDSYPSDRSSSFRSGSRFEAQNQHEEERTLKLLKTPTVFPQKNTLKGIVLSVTDLVGITSGTIHQHPSNPSPPPPSSSHPTNSSSSSSSVVYFLHDEDENQELRARPLSRQHESEKEEHSTILLGRNSTSFGHHPVTNIAVDDDVADEQLFLDDSQNQEKQQQQATHFPPSVHKESSTVQPRRPRERRVPSTPIGRALGFASLGAGLAWGTVQESARRLVYGSQSDNEKNHNSKISPFLSEQNAERLALALCRMRGAALKLGQMLSIQDESLIPAPILSALDIVRQGADVMPRSQLNDVLDAELGLNWSTKLKSFDYEPLAAASIGQVHRAVTKDDMVVAMKIQYPGVADSIDSDIENMKRLLDYTNIIPKGLFLDKAIKVAKEELSRECDYVLEAQSQKRFRELLSTTEGVYVPLVITGISSRRILTTEFVPGIPIDKVAVLNQETRNYIGRKLLEVTLKELFVFRFMQTDPNWSNFLYDEDTKMINLIDFGAAREYRKSFVDDYLRMVLACANRDRNTVIEMSTRLGFLTGMESEIMLDAHVQASFIVGLPFSTSDAYDFRSSNIIGSISHLGATMLRHRLTPPPDEAYSLHRKLSGAFLACIKLGVVAPCRDLLLQVHQQYRFSDENEEISALS